MHIPISYNVGNKTVETKALIDSGAGGRFISFDLAKKLGRTWDKLEKPIKVYNVDGTPNKTDRITHSVLFEFETNGRKFYENLLISGLGSEELIFGLPWLRSHNRIIDWISGEITFRPPQKIAIKRFVGVLDEEKKTPEIHIRRLLDTTPVETLITERTLDDIDPKGITEEVHIRLKTSTSQTLAHATKKKKNLWKNLIPPYLLDYRKHFEKGAAELSPESRPYDHVIELRPDFKPINKPIYKLDATQTKLMEEFIEENLRKDYIRPSTSPIASPFFFVAKKEKGALRPCQDYCDLNAGTVKNAYPLPLFGDLLDKFKGATIFQNLIYEMVTTTSELKMVINGKWLFEPVKDTTNPRSCSSDSLTPRRASKPLWMILYPISSLKDGVWSTWTTS
ncbi:hypothetical protein MPER_08468 [Moniliophthora perniciosa FA553]|nr:hypothetical protein MPER_08468 [Moniliophthora perniciosa FA553]